MNKQEVITLDGINIYITRKPNLKHIYIRIKPPEGVITVNASSSLPLDDVKSFVQKNMPKIHEAIRKFQEQPRLAKRKYVSGELCYLWGFPYKLKVVYGAEKSSVVPKRTRIILNVPKNASLELRRKVMTEWYRAEFKRALPSLLYDCKRITGMSPRSCTIKMMRTRWGSCNHNTWHINLNLNLAKKPLTCVRYVIIHEIVHFIEVRHNKTFKRLLSAFYPQWYEDDKLLRALPLDHMEDW